MDSVFIDRWLRILLIFIVVILLMAVISFARWLFLVPETPEEQCRDSCANIGARYHYQSGSPPVCACGVYDGNNQDTTTE